MGGGSCPFVGISISVGWSYRYLYWLFQWLSLFVNGFHWFLIRLLTGFMVFIGFILFSNEFQLVSLVGH